MLLSEDQTAVYLAKVDGREVLVKFVALALTYNTRARRLLAGDCLAPKLIVSSDLRTLNILVEDDGGVKLFNRLWLVRCPRERPILVHR